MIWTKSFHFYRIFKKGGGASQIKQTVEKFLQEAGVRNFRRLTL